jgi:hypothetical protein
MISLSSRDTPAWEKKIYSLVTFQVVPGLSCVLSLPGAAIAIATSILRYFISDAQGEGLAD